MTSTDRFARWKAIAGDPGVEAWSEPEHLARFFQRFRPDGLGVERAFYASAGDYSLARHLLWPSMASRTTIEDPFAACFELWRHGAEVRFESAERLAVYVH